MKERLVNPETAKLLKEVGFRAKTFSYYSKMTGRLKPVLFHNGVRRLNVKGVDNPRYILHDWNKRKLHYSAPTLSYALKWVKNRFALSILSDSFFTEGKLRFDVTIKRLGDQDITPEQDLFREEEDALEYGLQKVLREN